MDIRTIVSSPRVWFAIGLIVIGAAARLVPSAPNVAPIAAIALLGGATLSFPWALLIPSMAILASDAIIGFYNVPVMVSVYISFIAMVILGRFLPRRFSPVSLLGASLAGSVLFYLVTNAAVWMFSPLYPTTVDGLVASYYYAIPFFRNTLGGDLVYVFTFFGAYHAVPHGIGSVKRLIHSIITAKRNTKRIATSLPQQYTKY